MNISEVLRLKFKDIEFQKDVIVQDDGKGAYIKEWNLKIPKPTQKDLEDWAKEFDLQHRQNLARQKRQYPSWQVQMDMQYHDSLEGTTNWVDSLKAIKAANPIPEE